MRRLEDYRDRYEHVRLQRTDEGVLTMTLHTKGGPLIWGSGPHEELGYCFADVAADLANQVVIMTGSGDQFIDAMEFPAVDRVAPSRYAQLYTDASRLLNALLSIEVPVIGAINGPARVHAELGVLSDIVIASDDAVFQDAPHFPSGLVPGDGVHVVWPLLLGPNRGRYFLLTGEEICAVEALRLGVVSEVVPRDALLPRAQALAALLLKQPALTRRYARALLTRRIQRQLFDELGFGLALEGMAWSEFNPAGRRIGSEREYEAAEKTSKPRAPSGFLSELGHDALPRDAVHMREIVDNAVERFNRDLPAGGEWHRSVPMRSVGDVHVTADVLVPKLEGPHPVMVFFHGGAWICGSAATHRKLAHRFAEGGFLVLSVEYRLAPEHPFPAGYEDCRYAFAWARSVAARFGGDSAKLVVVGDSAGANLAAAALVHTAEDERAQVAAVALIYGFFDYERMYQKRVESTEARARHMSDLLTSAYFGSTRPTVELLRDPRVSPIHRAEALPPVYLLCGSEDPFLEQNEAMAAVLDGAGVECELVVPEGMPHGFLQQEEEHPCAVEHIERIGRFLHGKLRRRP